MKSIETLVDDIRGLFTSRPEVPPDTVDNFGKELAGIIRDRLLEERGAFSLRISNLGTVCKRKLWYDKNSPEKAEPLSPDARLKFLYGDILECLMLFLAKIAGHEVTEQQKEVDLHGVKGHIDGVIDGVLVDVKSCSTYSFDKFKTGLNEGTDSFGYLTQLDGYLNADNMDDGAFLAVDKTLGHITLDRHKRSNRDYAKEIAETTAILNEPSPPPRGYSDVPEGKSGNRKLCMECSYCSHKFHCWPDLRRFTYARGPVYLTVVKKEPRVDEA